MRQRAIRMVVTAVAVGALVLGVPGAILGSILVWRSEENSLDLRAEALVRTIDRRLEEGLPITESVVQTSARPLTSSQGTAHTEVIVPGQYDFTVEEEITGPSLETTATSAQGTFVRMEVSAIPAIRRVATVVALFIAGMLVNLTVGWMIGRRASRELSAPLIYLAAQAEQIGSGQVRARVRPSGIEEIDLVQDELVRTGERTAGRLAAERQFAADASHQLRTPLTALSMRLEEIEMIAPNEEVRTEAQECLKQVERLTAVVSNLMDVSQRDSSNTEAIHLLEIFNEQREEWEKLFDQQARTLVFSDETEQPVLADAASLNQVLATLIENSLRYGGGTTKVAARTGTTKRGIIIDVSDEGEGVDDEIAPDIFKSGVSGHGSTGIGLALAKNLTQSMGGRLELTQRRPPIFTVSLSAIPSSLDPDKVMPEGALVSVGRRSRRH